MKLMPLYTLSMMIALMLIGSALAQDELFEGEDDLFGESLVTDIEAGVETNAAEALLKNDGLVIGGNYRLRLDASLLLNPPEDTKALSTGVSDVGARIFLDARPRSDFAMLLKGDLSYSTDNGFDAQLRELFADVDVFDGVFLRAGKQTINWGVGYFFSPANLINIERIDPENPDAELAGPVALKAQVPLGRNNLSSYLIADDFDSDFNFTLASRYEFLLEGYEITLGGIYQPQRPWAVMATGAGSIGKVSVFAEAVLRGNSDKVFIVEDASNPLGISTETRADQVFFLATVGGRYSYTTEDQLLSFGVSGQYFYNGLGYADPNSFANYQEAIGALLAQGVLSVGDLLERGQHYLALSLFSSNIYKTNLTPSLLWLANLTDSSGFVNANLNYQMNDYLNLSLGYRYNYGTEGAEYSPLGNRQAISLGLSVSGNF